MSSAEHYCGAFHDFSCTAEPQSDVEALVTARESVFDLHATAGLQEFAEHDLYVSVHRGGPGLGEVLERDPEEVDRDLDSADL